MTLVHGEHVVGSEENVEVPEAHAGRMRRAGRWRGGLRRRRCTRRRWRSSFRLGTGVSLACRVRVVATPAPLGARRRQNFDDDERVAVVLLQTRRLAPMTAVL